MVPLFLRPSVGFSCSLGISLHLQEGPGQMLSLARAATPVLGPSGLACALEMNFTAGPQGTHRAVLGLASPSPTELLPPRPVLVPSWDGVGMEPRATGRTFGSAGLGPVWLPAEPRHSPVILGQNFFPSSLVGSRYR